MLIDAGASADARAPGDGTTPLYRTDRIEIMRLLVPAARKINSADRGGMTALDYHMQWPGREEIIRLLREHGARPADELGPGSAEPAARTPRGAPVTGEPWQ